MYLNLKKEEENSDEVMKYLVLCYLYISTPYINTMCCFLHCFKLCWQFLDPFSNFWLHCWHNIYTYIYEIKGLANYLFTMLTSFHFPPRFFNLKKNYPIKFFYSNKDKYHVCCIWNWTILWRYVFFPVAVPCCGWKVHADI